MLIPCIDLQGGQAVQLVRGRKRELAVAAVFGLLRKFKRYPWLHVIDLDAAMGKGQNGELVRELCTTARKDFGMQVRVGGGIRTVSRAEEIVGWGASQIIVGSAAFRHGKVNIGFLQQLAKTVRRKQIIIALDTAGGNITIHGWRKRIALQADKVMTQLEHFCAGFLCTDVDREGTMTGANLEWFRRLRDATSHPIIAAGGIKTRREIAALEKMGMDAAVGMAMYITDACLRWKPVIWQVHSAASAQIRVGDVLLHHALRVEERSVDGNSVLHDGQKLGAIVVVHRKNHALQLAIKRFGFSRIVGRSAAGSAAPRFADAPAGDAFNVAFHPPAVKNAQTWHAIQRGLHTAGA